MFKYYFFLRFTSKPRVGHNALAAFSYFVMYLLMLVEILTGLGLYSYVLSKHLHRLEVRSGVGAETGGGGDPGSPCGAPGAD